MGQQPGGGGFEHLQELASRGGVGLTYLAYPCVFRARPDVIFPRLPVLGRPAPVTYSVSRFAFFSPPAAAPLPPAAAPLYVVGCTSGL